MTQTTWTPAEIEIMKRALPVIEAVPAMQDQCWPGDGPAHDAECTYPHHEASAAAVKATEGVSWEFHGWTSTARMFRNGIDNSHPVRQGRIEMESEIIMISDAIEIHPSGNDWSVVRNGAVYGTYPDLDQARELAEELAG